MRPEIANLVAGTIYDELDNDPSVTTYPKVMGVTKNLYFISHTELEKSVNLISLYDLTLARIHISAK
jgi:hypothetical protein